jgi:flavin-dependent dehydrogenase
LVDFDLAIVGGGPAGAATALFLCHHAPALRERVVLIDKAHFPREKICAGAIGARADGVLASIGVKIDVPGVTISGLSVRAPSGELSERLGGAPIGRVIRRMDYDAALLDIVRERGIEVRTGVALRSLSRGATQVSLNTDAGALRVRAVVGADGVASVVRRAIGMPRGPLHAQAVEVDTEALTDEPSDLLRFDMCNRFAGYAWDFPTLVGGRPMMCRGVYQLTRGAPASDTADDDTIDVSQRLRTRLEQRGIDPQSLRFKRFAERGLPLHSPTGVERVVLVGEAAGIDPVLGEGIPQAICYGATAGAYLAHAVSRGDYRFGDYRSAVMSSRVGLDLKIRSALLGLVYGRRRAWIERAMTRSRHLSIAGMHYFAGRRVPRARLAGALWDLLRAAAPI